MRRLIVVLIVLGLLLPTLSHPVAAQTPPWVLTNDAYAFVNPDLTVDLWIDVWVDPKGNDPTYMFAQYQSTTDPAYPDAWIPISGFDISTSRNYWFHTTVLPVDTYEVRAATYCTGHGYVYGNIRTLTVPGAAEPSIATGSAYWTSETTANVGAYGDPKGTGYLYVQYREQGEPAWIETDKEYIFEWSSRTFSLSDLDILDTWEARAALDYDETTIYGEIVTITDYGGEDLECIYQPAGAGTEANPYIITDICELNWMRNSLAAYYELGNAIDATMTHYWDGGAGWTPVGTFTGHFDGKGFDISGLYIDRYGDSYQVALFTALDDATVQNLVLVNPWVRNTYYGSRTAILSGTAGGSSYVGNVHVVGGYVERWPHPDGTSSGASTAGLIGYIGASASTLEYSSFMGTVKTAYTGASGGGGLVGHSTGTIYRCFVDVELIGNSNAWDSARHGGLVGQTSGGSIVESFAVGSLYAPAGQSNWANPRYLGGLVGYLANTTVTDCYARVTITTTGGTAGYIGGAFGQTGGTVNISNSYATGLINTAGTTLIGGFIGYQQTASPSITNCFWDTQTTGYATSGCGLATGKTTAQMKTQSTFTDAGWDFVDIWGMNSGINDGYPHLHWASYYLEVDTLYPEVIGSTSFHARGEITAAQPDAAKWGFAYFEGNTGTPTLDDTVLYSTGNLGEQVFSIPVRDLTPTTAYRVRAFAENGPIGLVWGNTITVVTTDEPAVVTVGSEEVSGILNQTSRKLLGFLEYDGGEDCHVRFEYGLASTPPLGQFTTWQTRYPVACPPRGFQTGDSFSTIVTDLIMGETYYFRAQAHNDEHGVRSGEIMFFTVGEEMPDASLVVWTREDTNYTGTQVMAHGEITYADPRAFRRGFVYLEGGVGTPDLTDDVVEQAGDFGVGTYSLLISGLSPTSQYRIRAFAENVDGVVYAPNTITVPPDSEPEGVPVMSTQAATDIGETSFRARGTIVETHTLVTRRGFVYLAGSTGTPTLTDSVTEELGSWGSTQYHRSVTGLAAGTYYRVRAFAENTAGVGYGNTVTVRTLGVPAVATNTATHIGTTTARLHGTLLNDGGDHCQYRFEWGYATGVYTYSSLWSNGLTTGTSFQHNLSGLDADVTYYFRAQARNGSGLVSGDELTFTTGDTLLPPSGFSAEAVGGTRIVVTWTRGAGAENTIVQMYIGAYPTNHEDGTRVYFDNGMTVTVTGLTPGTTYYFSAWSEAAGTVSATYAQDLATTLAGDPDPDPDPDPDDPDDPNWFEPGDPDIGDMPFHDQITDNFDLFELPHSSGWMILSLLAAALIGLGILAMTGSPWAAILGSAGVIVTSAVIGFIPLWPLLIVVAFGGGYAYIRSRP